MAEAVQNPQPSVDEQTQQSGVYADYYNSLVSNPWVQQAISTYDWTKHSCSFLENTLDKVEERVSGAAQYAGQKASDTYTNYYVRPKEAVTGAVNAGVEKTKWAVDTSKNVAVHTGTVGIGAAVLVTQLGLQLSAGGAGLFLDSIGAAQGAGRSVITSVRDAEKAVEAKIWNAVGEVQRVAKIPINKASETTHSILDVISALLERTMGAKAEELPEFSIKQRVTAMATAVVAVLTSTAHKQVIDPVQAQLQSLIERLSQSFILVDVIRARKEWALEKYEELSASVSDLKTRFEDEAKEYKTRPEEMLVKSIRGNADQLRETLENIKNKGNQVFGNSNDGTPTKIDAAISYLQGLEGQLSQAGDIYQIRDEVLSEARQRLAELAAWTTGLLTRNSSS